MTGRPNTVQMSAKLAALRGESLQEEGPNSKISTTRSSDPEIGNASKSSRIKKLTGGKDQKRFQRFMDKSGHCNIRQAAVQLGRRYMTDIFTTLVDLRWTYNLAIFVLTYIGMWSIFAVSWWLIAYIRGDIAAVQNNVTDHRPCVQNVYSYSTAFLFFIETETTIGYGKRAITDECPEAIVLFVFQSLIGSIVDAFMVGCIFIKLSQPKDRSGTLVFSETAVLSVRDGQYCLMFRVGNLRNSLIVSCRIRAKLVKSRQTLEGEFIGLDQDDINIGFDTGADKLFLVTPIIICHLIDKKSPFYKMSQEDIKSDNFEIIVILEGTTESTGMLCQARTSYLNSEVQWGHRFMPVLFHARDHFAVDHSEFHSTYEVPMPKTSSRRYNELQSQQSVVSKFSPVT